MPAVLVVSHSRTGTTAALTQSALDGATEAISSLEMSDVSLLHLDAFDAGPDDVLGADGILISTPARFGWMSGAMKDFFERIYPVCESAGHLLPYAAIVKGDTDVDGALSSVERLALGLGWRVALPPMTVVGMVSASHVDQARELGATFAAGVGTQIF